MARAVELSFLILCLIYFSQSINVNDYCVHPFPTTRLTPEYPLKHLTVLIRHGDRTPLSAPCWENSPEWKCHMYHQERPAKHPGNGRLYNRVYMAGRNKNPGNCSAGQLTVQGYEQQVTNGQALRALYTNKIPTVLDEKTVYLRSTDIPRTFLSAEALLFGLFPPGKDCLTESINIKTMDINLETMTPNAKQCPRLDTIRQKLEKSAPYQEYVQSKIAPLENRVDQALNKKANVPYNIDDIFDCVQAHACHELPFPKEFSQDMYDSITEETIEMYRLLSFANDTNGYNYAQIGMSKFIGEVLQRITDASKGLTSEKLALFSGHDTTLLPFLLAYGIDVDWPPYASMIRIELLDGGAKGDLIRLYYNNKPRVVLGCPDYTCPLATFTKVSGFISAADQYCDRNRKPRRRFGRFHILPELGLNHEEF